ncbi:PHF20 [Mytilus edulis]|uniref:PHF20 n=1 Tax=Mytilus edulis TaxID=6550 RepID=A0A8S3SJI4_MYTED|nr:PHF20 [Mytilus edulis]
MQSDQLLRRTEASLDSWKTVDKDFQSLAGLTSRSKFISTLQTVLEELNIDFYDVNDTSNDGASGSSSEIPLQQPAKKPKYKHNNSFLEEVQIMRELHPKKEDYVYNQFWDSSHKEWRQLCASSLGFERGMEGTFGGTFRERLYVSTLPQSCFDIVKDLEDSMTQGMVRSSFKTTQLTGGLFQSFVGFKEERPVRFALQQLVNGTTTMKEFREKGKSLKDTNRHVQQNDTEEIRQTRIIQQQGEEINSLKAENVILKAENDRLKTLLSEVEQTNASTEEVTQDDDTDSNQDEDELAVGTQVSARWTDGSFYNAVIISKRKNGYYVKFYDGWKRVVSRQEMKRL